MDFKSVGISFAEMFYEDAYSSSSVLYKQLQCITQPPAQGLAFLCTTSHHTCHLQIRVGTEELLCYLLLLN